MQAIPSRSPEHDAARVDPAHRPDGSEWRQGLWDPTDNPFVDGGGAPEVYLYGVRNPWRIAFDTVTDDLWVADVGQNGRRRR